MRKILLSAILLTSSISIANASVLVFSDNFDGDTIGLNAIPSGWTVTGGTVDIIGSGSGFDFIPGNGKYIDLDGSSNSAGGLSKSFNAVSGNTYTTTFSLAGNQKSGFEIVDVNFGNVSQSFNLASSAGFSTVTMSFTALTSSLTSLIFQDHGDDNVGALLDNVTLSVSAVPEAEEWAMMMLGLGIMGFVAKRKKSN